MDGRNEAGFRLLDVSIIVAAIALGLAFLRFSAGD
jgi:hypothetical protein